MGSLTQPANAVGSPGVKKLSVRHEQIMNFMIANPDVPLGTVAREFGLTHAWMSTVVNTELFQNELRERMGEVWGENLTTIREKLLGLGTRAVERLLDKVDLMEDVTELQKTADLALRNSGYATSPGEGNTGGNGQTNNFLIVSDPSALEHARSLMSRTRVSEPDLEGHTLEQGPVEGPDE